MPQSFNPLFSSLPTTVFEAMSRLARENNAINLGQGFPDDAGPLDVREAAAKAVVDGYNQYPPMMGIPELRSAIATHYQRFYGLSISPETETMVTSGATEALTAAILATVSPGDEVVLFEPLYDSYLPIVRLAGGVPKLVTLHPPHWRFSEADLAAAITERTKLVIINDPLNPAGSVMPAEDLDLLARHVSKTDALVLQDGVWEHVVFDGRPFTPLITRPGMRERVIHIGSAGKIFSLTGWKIGLVVAAPAIMRVLGKSHQFLTFTTAPNLQAAVAYGLGKEDSYFLDMRADLAKKRDHLTDGLTKLGLKVLPCQGTYFLNVDLAGSGINMDDRDFCELMVKEGGVAAIPVSAFYETGTVRSVVRLCFAKKFETLDAALARISAFLPRLRGSSR